MHFEMNGLKLEPESPPVSVLKTTTEDIEKPTGKGKAVSFNLTAGDREDDDED
jgi:hypothetical protein